jgi:TonB family protein
VIDAKFDTFGRQCGSGRTNSVLIHFAIILEAATFLAVPSAKILGQVEQQTPAKCVGLIVRILTNVGNVNFNAYVVQLSTAVRHNWTASMPESVKAGETGVVIIRLQVRTDGTFLNDTPKVETSSRRDELDNAAIAAIRAAAPFPHLRDDFHGSNIELRMTFLCNVPAKAPPDTTSPQ